MLRKTCDPGMLLEERGGSSGWIVTLPEAWDRGDWGWGRAGASGPNLLHSILDLTAPALVFSPRSLAGTPGLSPWLRSVYVSHQGSGESHGNLIRISLLNHELSWRAHVPSQTFVSFVILVFWAFLYFSCCKTHYTSCCKTHYAFIMHAWSL